MDKDKDKQFRSLEFDVREKADDNTLEVEGYIAKFDTVTELWEGFFEKIDRKAFDDTISDGHNIFLVYHHDMSKPLASTRNNTLELSTDNVGLKFKGKLNKGISYANDVYELVNSGEVRGCSFGFYIRKQNYAYDKDTDTVTRTIEKVDLVEGTITPIPAYEDTEVSSTRYKEEFEKVKNQNQPSFFIEVEKIRNKILLNMNK